MEYIDEFLIDLEYAKNYSKNTISSYNSDLLIFSNFIKKDLNKISTSDIRKFIKYLSDKKDKTLARYLTTLRMFYDFMIKKKYMTVSPMDGISSPKLSKHLPDVLDIEEVDKLLDFKTDTNFAYRDRCILELLYSSGLRISELVSLKLENININESFVKVMGKGSKERVVPFNDITTNYLDEYIKNIRPNMLKGVATDYLFLNNHGKNITRQAVFKMLKKRAGEAGIKKNISPHTLRHSFATHLLLGGADIRFIQELLGHENIATTEIYTHIALETLQKDYNELNPRDN